MVCLLAAPWVQLSVSAGNGWPHNALRHHWLMPISCHFRDCKALLVMSPTHVSGAIASVQTLTFTFTAINSACFCVCSRLVYQFHYPPRLRPAGGYCFWGWHTCLSVVLSVCLSVRHVEWSDLLQIKTELFVDGTSTWYIFDLERSKVKGQWSKVEDVKFAKTPKSFLAVTFPQTLINA